MVGRGKVAARKRAPVKIPPDMIEGDEAMRRFERALDVAVLSLSPEKAAKVQRDSRKPVRR